MIWLSIVFCFSFSRPNKTFVKQRIDEMTRQHFTLAEDRCFSVVFRNFDFCRKKFEQAKRKLENWTKLHFSPLQQNCIFGQRIWNECWSRKWNITSNYSPAKFRTIIFDIFILTKIGGLEWLWIIFEVFWEKPFQKWFSTFEIWNKFKTKVSNVFEPWTVLAM